MGLHSKQTAADGIHVVQAYEVPNASGRTSLSLTAADIGKVVRQLDDESFWLIDGISPNSFVRLGSGGSASLFGQDYQYVVDETQSSTTSTTFQIKVSLTTPTLTGIYRVGWCANVYASSTNTRVEAELFDLTNGVALGQRAVHEMKDARNRVPVGEFFELSFATESRQLAIQWRKQGGGTVYIRGARIEIWRVG